MVIDAAVFRRLELEFAPATALPRALNSVGGSGVRAKLAATDAITRPTCAAYGGVMYFTRSFGECWCVVMKVVSLQKSGIRAGGGHGNGPPRLLSTGEGEHSCVSMRRTGG